MKMMFKLLLLFSLLFFSVVKENEELVRFPMHMSDSDDPQINLPVNDSVETPALKQILSVSWDNSYI